MKPLFARPAIVAAVILLFPAITTADGFRYEVLLEQTAQPNTDPHREAMRVIEMHRLHSGATKEDGERNYPSLIKAFKEERAGFKRHGKTKTYYEAERTLVVSFTPTLGTGTSGAALEYFDGAITIEANGRFGPNLPDGAMVLSGDRRNYMMRDAERLVFFDRQPRGKRVSHSIAAGKAVTVYEDVHDGLRRRLVLIRSAPGGILENAVSYKFSGGRMFVAHEIRVTKSGIAGGRMMPTNFEILRLSGGRIFRREQYKLVESGLKMPSVSNVLPIGTRMVDYRVGDRPANYEWNGFIPPVSEIARDDNGSKPSNSSGIGIPLAGCGLLLIAVSLWFRNRPVPASISG